MVIGLTGGIGSGKTTVTKYFAKLDNVAIYNADDEAKKLMTTSEELKQKLQQTFGKDTFINSHLNREYLANIVFQNKEKLHLLNGIVHPVVHNHLKLFLKNNQTKSYIIYENAILFENNSQSICNKIITITAPLALRIKRVIQRDKSSFEKVSNRIKNQWNEEKKTIQSHYIIHNIDLAETEKKVISIHKSIMNKIK